jgi:glycerophosphoryl diester phosphodiesterase
VASLLIFYHIFIFLYLYRYHKNNSTQAFSKKGEGMNKMFFLFFIFYGFSLHAVLIIGHRGSPQQEPENTLASFQKAIDNGIEMIELDVHQCKTGEIVVLHDDTVDRTTNGSGLVAKKTFAQLRLLDAGKNQKIPTLEEVFILINRRAKINIELKGDATAILVAQLICSYIKNKGWHYDDFLVSSFDWNELAQFKRICPGIPVGLLCEGMHPQCSIRGQEIRATTITLDDHSVDCSVIDNIHKHGFKCFVYTVNDIRRAKELAECGVDGIITDIPEIIKDLI